MQEHSVDAGVFIRSLASRGQLGGLSAAVPQAVRVLEAAGYQLDVSAIIAAKVMDITPEFIAKVRAGGFKNMTIDKLIQLKNADIF